MFFQPGESPKAFVVVCDLIEPAINVAPRARPLVDNRQISLADQYVKRAVGCGKKIAQIERHLGGRYPRESIAQPGGGAVVSLAKPGGQDQDFFHHALNKSGAVAKRTQV